MSGSNKVESIRVESLGRRLLLAAALLLAVGARSEAGPSALPEATTGPTGFWANVAWATRRVKLHCRTSAAGKFLTNALRPISKLTGGIIPVPDDNHFAAAVELNATQPAGMAPGATPKPPPPPPPGVAAAAQIKAEQAQAKIRREAVAYLAGVDCRYYPEAEAALIASLRADRDECVRLEAARALMCGCCCTPATVKALTVCVTGSEQDGNPAECSDRVRRAALAALQKCLSCVEGAPAPGASPEPPLSTAGAESSVLPAAFESTPTATKPAGTARPRGLLDLWKAAGEDR